MVGVPGTASDIFGSVRDAGVNVIMISQASSEHSVCFAVKSEQAAAAVDCLEAKCGHSSDHAAVRPETSLLQQQPERPGSLQDTLTTSRAERFCDTDLDSDTVSCSISSDVLGLPGRGPLPQHR